MARRAERLIGIVASTSPDVKSYKLYWGPSKKEDGSDNVLNNDPKAGPVSAGGIDIGIPTEKRVVDDQEVLVVSLDSVEELNDLPEGDYDIGFSSFDGLNESDITEAEDVTLDLTPPAAPGKVFILSPP